MINTKTISKLRIIKTIRTKAIQPKVNRLRWKLRKIKTINKLVKQININEINYKVNYTTELTTNNSRLQPISYNQRIN